MKLTDIASYRAFIRKNGSHSTKTTGFRNWNAELIRNANVVLARDWASMDEQIASGFDRHSADMKKSLDMILESASSMCVAESRPSFEDIDKCDLDNIAPRAFIDNIRARQITLRHRLDNEFRDYQKALG